VEAGKPRPPRSRRRLNDSPVTMGLWGQPTGILDGAPEPRLPGGGPWAPGQRPGAPRFKLISARLRQGVLSVSGRRVVLKQDAVPAGVLRRSVRYRRSVSLSWTNSVRTAARCCSLSTVTWVAAFSASRPAHSFGHGVRPRLATGVAMASMPIRSGQVRSSGRRRRRDRGADGAASTRTPDASVLTPSPAWLGHLG